MAKSPSRQHRSRASRLALSPGQPGVNVEAPPPGSTPRAAHGEAFPVVGIGASAGGLEAFTQLLKHLPSDTGMGFVLVQHLDPAHESKLTELLGRATTMPVVEVRNGMRVAPDRVYVIPPNRGLVMDDGRLRLTPRGRGRVLPVDAFLKSLAQERGRQAIGVILSGTATDGAEGMQVIKEAGGITFAQDEESAKYNGMPETAIATGCVDFVLPPELIARELAEISKHPYVKPAAVTAGAAETGDGLQRILRLVLQATGVDFTHYKPATLQRRIQRRMALHRIHKLDRYTEFLKTHSGEAEKLYEDLLIAVTGFFRDPAAFQVLRRKVFPRLLEQRRRGEAIRIWVAGCSSGEEAYSVAITLLECLGGRTRHVPLQIFATDISDRALEKARAGVYPASIARVVGRQRLRRYFTEVRGGYQINKDIRERCVFAKQNLTKDPPFSNLDLISCRNVLIYLGPVLQQRVLSVFHYALKPHGLLLLGASESTTGFQHLFSVVDKTQKVFAKKPSARRVPLDFQPTELPAEAPEPAQIAGKAGWRLPDVQKEADRLLATRFAPASVLINDECEILQFRGHTGAYLEPASGAASLNLLKMAREGLLMGLRSALAKARKQRAPVRQEGLRVNSNGATRTVNLEIVPLKLVGTRERHWLVLFEEPVANVAPAAPAPPARPLTKSESDRQIAQLEQELSATKEYMQSVVEDFEAANEELKAANEEVQSGNEELQSTNEELETAKEELQSANEELTTVNEELETRNAELVELNDAVNRSLREVKAARDYAEAIIATARQPMVALNAALRVHTVNAAFLRAFKVTRKQTIGQRIYDLGNRQWDIPELRRLLEEILPADTHFDDYRVEHVFPKIGRRTMLVNARRLEQADGQRPLILLVIEDITERKQAEERLKELNATLEHRVAGRTKELTDTNERLHAIMDTALIGIITLDERGVVESFNPAALQIFGYAPKEFLGRNVSRFMASPNQAQHEDFIAHYLQARNASLMGGTDEVLGRRKDGDGIMLEISLAEITDGGRRRFVAMLRNITARKGLERELLDITERERQRIGHDLHDGLGQQLHGLSYLGALLEKDLQEDTSPRAAKAGQLNKGLHEALEMTRSLAHGLQPVKSVPEGLMTALRELAERTRGLYRIDCRFDCRAPLLIQRHSAANHLYRIAQEAVNNAMKHGKPTHVRIKLAATRQRIVLGVRDNGVGIRRQTKPGRGMGLHVMQYRADAISGSLIVQRHSQGGTEVVCTVNRKALLPQEDNLK